MVPEKVPGIVTVKVPGKVSGKMSGKVPEKVRGGNVSMNLETKISLWIMLSEWRGGGWKDAKMYR